MRTWVITRSQRRPVTNGDEEHLSCILFCHRRLSDSGISETLVVDDALTWSVDCPVGSRPSWPVRFQDIWFELSPACSPVIHAAATALNGAYYYLPTYGQGDCSEYCPFSPRFSQWGGL